MRQFALDAANEVRHESDMKQKVGAALVRGNRIIGLASNRTGKSPTGSWSRHAEIRATLNRDAGGADIYVARSHGKDGTFTLARPCNRCKDWLSALGIRRVYYTVDNGWEMVRLN